ncbi:hypothetical protein SEA_GUUELAD_135 [Mycobacterium phage GuuelaD]|uniref:DUF7192 domain-containing protein n=1 Tax=Mycobacterium phage GuuelaD TaxID=2015819 RepID=A0A286MQN3_9CAUD|nr:hypothetical protein J4T97_gp106 [Mycobacterium phage GuuelaD]ASW31558.1 hypothetical protein SEA_GUUELAD_135 [Mycobacterium phage GuuelaD]
MQVTKKGNVLQHSYASLAEFSEYQRANQQYAMDKRDAEANRAFSGVASIDEACDKAQRGLPEEGVKVLDTSRALADSAMRQVSAYDMESTYDVAGSYVDMGRFVTGEPECMIQTTFDEVPVTRPVVTIVSNINASGGIDKDDLRERGRLIVALIKAVETSGRSTELWVDSTNQARGNRFSELDEYFRISVKIKAASQPLDMGAVMYAFTDPSMLRVLGFNAMHALPKTHYKRYGIGFGYGCVVKESIKIEESYGPGAVYLPAVRLGDNAESTVTEALHELGIG